MNVIFSSLFSFSIISRRFSVDLESRFAVGSSARINLGFEANALATATRCCWPPDSLFGRLFFLSPKPTASSSSLVRLSLSSFRFSLQMHYKLYIFLSSENRYQIIRLKNKPNISHSEISFLTTRKFINFYTINNYISSGRIIQSTNNIEQGSFS